MADKIIMTPKTHESVRMTTSTGSGGRTCWPYICGDDPLENTALKTLLDSYQSLIPISSEDTGLVLSNDGEDLLWASAPSTLPDQTNNEGKYLYTDGEDASWETVSIPDVPTKLSDLQDDSTHRLVTDTEKSTWNGKQDALSNADSTHSGILTSTDWNTFNGKAEGSHTHNYLPLPGGVLTGDLSFDVTTKAGLRLNNLTTTQRDAISSPANGMVAYDTDKKRMVLYGDGAWTNGFVRVGGDTMTGGLIVAEADSSALTDVLVNPTAKTSGNLLDLQVGGKSAFNVTYKGAITTYGSPFRLYYYADTALYPKLTFLKSRGTIDSPAPLLANDVAGWFDFTGRKSTSSTATFAELKAVCDVNASASDYSSHIEINTANVTTLTNMWKFGPAINTAGAGIIFSTDNTYDIGAVGATRPRTGYFGTSVSSPLVVTPIVAPSADGVTAVKITKADTSTTVLNVDTTNSRVGLAGQVAPTEMLHGTGNLKLDGTIGPDLQPPALSDTYYTRPAGWTTDGTKMSKTGDGTGNVTTTFFSVEAGADYYVSFTLANWTAGTCYAYIGGGLAVATSSNGMVSTYVRTTNTNIFYLTGSNGGRFDVTAVKVYKVTNGGITLPYGSISPTGKIYIPTGSSYYPAIAFDSNKAYGIWSIGTTVYMGSNNGAISVSSSALTTPSSISIGGNTLLYSDGNFQLGLRYLTNAQRIGIYNTYTSTTSYERLDVDWIGEKDVCNIRTAKGSGGGTLRDLKIQNVSAGKVTIGASDGYMAFFAGTPVLQQNHIADANTNYTTGDLDTEAEIITAMNATNTTLNALLLALENYALLKSS